jgi:hypothetical protein
MAKTEPVKYQEYSREEIAIMEANNTAHVYAVGESRVTCWCGEDHDPGEYMGWARDEWRILALAHRSRNGDELPSHVLRDREAQKPTRTEIWAVLMDSRVRAAFKACELEYPALDDLFTAVEREMLRK